ncbi:hypothetical protein C2E21_3816 [Chlorella sorokiniana]|uniref:Uncharacterized protein n=1 Tax=Chlorella sorokiniana TaxID=3076 RepID=A0A2P6TTC2_CHLSO|nr:hypothetical protein C2E21_3816 [Chlorella sorokiniana]|eukprot:PRW57311.1 hypothetical protein C2E21_3816 [Chlorella sorokiniana]
MALVPFRKATRSAHNADITGGQLLREFNYNSPRRFCDASRMWRARPTINDLPDDLLGRVLALAGRAQR